MAGCRLHQQPRHARGALCSALAPQHPALAMLFPAPARHAPCFGARSGGRPRQWRLSMRRQTMNIRKKQTAANRMGAPTAHAGCVLWVGGRGGCCQRQSGRRVAGARQLDHVDLWASRSSKLTAPPSPLCTMIPRCPAPTHWQARAGRPPKRVGVGLWAPPRRASRRRAGRRHSYRLRQPSVFNMQLGRGGSKPS